jgi:MOSC domain-containing protein YiiM
MFHLNRKEEAEKILRDIEEKEKTSSRTFANLSTLFTWGRAEMTVMGMYEKAEIPRIDQLSEDRAYKDMSRDQFMCRRRIERKTSADGENNLGTMLFPGRGLQGSTFWHMDDSDGRKEGIIRGRDVLFQSVENYNLLSNEPNFAPCFEDLDFLESPTFGEQVIVQGYDSSQLAIGDVFEVEGGLSNLVLQISCPRLPCCHVDYSHGTPTGMKGMKRHCMTHGLAGWFARVLTHGELRDGMRLVRTKHPHPKWTLTFLSKALYGEGDRKALAMSKAHWVRHKKELVELIQIPELAGYEWKDEAQIVLKKIEKEEEDNPRSILDSILCFQIDALCGQ